MKRFTNFNTVFGALVGALPPYLGWAAAGGSLLSL
jgi:heme O synthase-like polyprenyltransferase